VLNRPNSRPTFRRLGVSIGCMACGGAVAAALGLMPVSLRDYRESCIWLSATLGAASLLAVACYAIFQLSCFGLSGPREQRCLENQNRMRAVVWAHVSLGTVMAASSLVRNRFETTRRVILKVQEIYRNSTDADTPKRDRVVGLLVRESDWDSRMFRDISILVSETSSTVIIVQQDPYVSSGDVRYELSLE
jgi:hypothetical protein